MVSKENREFDGVVAERIMGWQRHVYGNWPWQMVPPGCDASVAVDDPAFVVLSVPNYSTDPAVIGELITALVDRGYFVEFHQAHPAGRGYYCTVEGADSEGVDALAEDVQMALCLAGTLAVDDEGRET